MTKQQEIQQRLDKLESLMAPRDFTLVSMLFNMAQQHFLLLQGGPPQEVVDAYMLIRGRVLRGLLTVSGCSEAQFSGLMDEVNVLLTLANELRDELLASNVLLSTPAAQGVH